MLLSRSGPIQEAASLQRQREEREKKLLENATLESGVVSSTKGDFGFLRSATRLEEVYYHVSHLVGPDADDEGGEEASVAGR